MELVGIVQYDQGQASWCPVQRHTPVRNAAVEVFLLSLLFSRNVFLVLAQNFKCVKILLVLVGLLVNIEALLAN